MIKIISSEKYTPLKTSMLCICKDHKLKGKEYNVKQFSWNSADVSKIFLAVVYIFQYILKCIPKTEYEYNYIWNVSQTWETKSTDLQSFDACTRDFRLTQHVVPNVLFITLGNGKYYFEN